MALATWLLPVPGSPKQRTFVGPLDEATLAQRVRLVDQRARQTLVVERGEGLSWRKLRLPQESLDTTPVARLDLVLHHFEQHRQCLAMPRLHETALHLGR